MEEFKAKRAVDLLLFAFLSVAVLSFSLMAGELRKGDYAGVALGGGVILFLLIAKKGALLVKEYGSAAVSLGFIFILSRTIPLPSPFSSLQGSPLDFSLLFLIMVAVFLIAGLIVNRSTPVLFNSLIDWSFLGALLFIYIFSPLVLLFFSGQEVGGLKMSLPLYLVAGEFFCFYLAINFLLRRGKYRRGFLVLFIVFLLFVIWHPLGR